MPIRDQKEPATPDNLSDMASRADLGPLDPDQALKIKLCELRIENRFLSTVGDLQSKVATLKVKHKNSLIELRDKLQTLILEDLLKVLVGILVALLSHNFSQKGMKAFDDSLTFIELFSFVVCLGFLIFRLISPTRRKREIQNELDIIEAEGKRS
jgi:hypothetical protein